MKLNPYLTFNGRCEEAFKFYEQHLGGKIEMFHRFGGSPMADQCPPGWADKVMHVSMELDGQILMGSDGPGSDYHGMQGFSLSLGAKDVAEAEKLFNALSVNAQIKMPLQQTFWALRFGMLVDQFGTPWMVNCEQPPA
ncbi:VOC family protein [Undibacterium terreum]|uniref:VOC family protein n=1 Tax=Undibacterium terreum TaxID=1224302 RepID=A0A916UFB9_9BURK|nr:VOC family protein [Undibacterium terreum]GGC70342.1 VOC family protein [Undibacterium terreum]